MINEEIRDREVRLISDTGEQLGIMSSRFIYVVAYCRISFLFKAE